MANFSTLSWLGLFTLSLVFLNVQAAEKYRITTISHAPFTIPKPGTDSGYEGFIIDLLKKLEDMLPGVEFVINHVEDGRFGMQDKDGKWTGMIGELVRNESDIAAAALTVTASRATVIQVSHPFLDVGLRILVKKPSKIVHVLERAGILLHPFAAGVWISVIVAFVVVAFLLYGIGRFNPAEEAGETNEHSLPVTTAFFMTFSMLSLQGFRLTPTSAAGRILVCFWWFFAVITIASYIASLGSFLFLTFPSVTKPLPFYSFQQMADQTKFQYGTLKAGSTYNLFVNAKDGVEKQIGSYLKGNTHVLVDSSKDGIQRAKAGRYGFIMESDSAYHAAANDCDLTVVGEQLTDKEYAFACRKGLEICGKLDAKIIELKENGYIRELLDTWMSGPCGKYQELSSPTVYDPPNMSQFMSEKMIDISTFTFPLVWLSVGIVASILASVVEIYCAGSKGTGGRGHRLPDDKRTFNDAVDMEA